MRIASLFALLMLLNACSSVPYRYPEEQGVTCYQTEEQEAKDLKTCLRVPVNPDATKWHRIRSWQDVGDIPETP